MLRLLLTTIFADFGAFIGGFGLILIAQIQEGRLGRPVDSEGSVSLIGIPLGLLVGAAFGWWLAGRIMKRTQPTCPS